ncbi:hypothetical protein MTY_0481 [Moorella thermoacetica Y72]|uniref:Uncharacterized protein n=1 Tax=Moorella thermoacetica Y72 TaxID=1325331 RepID=A0A0S6U9N9_NEOTH|nr:hypothetical protein MTY_0481 [Moorella thermoacetica Y72]
MPDKSRPLPAGLFSLSPVGEPFVNTREKERSRPSRERPLPIKGQGPEKIFFTPPGFGKWVFIWK